MSPDVMDVATRVGPSFVHGLAAHGARPALIAGAAVVTYAQLDRAVDERALTLGSGRRLIALPVASTLDCIVTLLAALRAGHVVALLPPCTADSIAESYRPDARWRDGRLETFSETPQHELHPELAVLLTTSGTTGSAKLVRLSAGNLASNAEAIAASLELDPEDRGATTLPLSYSYGLSVLTSHLAAGASLLVTEESVTSAAFPQLVRDSGVSTLAAVPYSLALMERTGLFDRPLPSLRMVTCAGGRLEPDRARRIAEVGRRQGWSLAVMYGQTEATARMTYLPGHLVAEHADCVGRPIPGGRLRIDAPDSCGVGEIVYSGPNVMLGYATSPSDLGRGAELAELRTGDLGRMTPDGLLQVCGRLSRTAKVRGLRISLDDIDTALAARGIEAASVARDEGIGVVAVTDDPAHVRSLAAAACAMPVGAIAVVDVDELPRTGAGKVDVAVAAGLIEARSASWAVNPNDNVLECLRETYSRLLGVEASAHDSFASLGGDSLSFVEVSVAVEEVLGCLPPEWHRTSLAELADRAVPTSRPGSTALRRLLRPRTLDATVVVRALAILLVVGSHAQAFDLRGGAHILLALVGFNLARFHLGLPGGRERLQRMWRSAARVLVPSVLFLGVLVLTGSYGWYLLGANFIVNPTQMAPEWRYWFIETLVWTLPIVVVLVSLPWVETIRRRYPLGLPLALTLGLFAAGRLLVPQEYPVSVFSPLAIAWFLVLGWSIAEIRSPRQRIALTIVIVGVVPWTLYGVRMLIVPLGLLALLWISRLRLPAAAAVVAAAVAEASLVIYLLHWSILDLLGGWPGAVLATLVGVAAWAAISRVRRLTRPAMESVAFPTKW